MKVNSLVVNELRNLFKAGATPSALIRRVAERHACEPQLDALVRAYFREAFHVPMLRVGPEQVRHIAAGGGLPALNATVLPRMIEARAEWDLTGGQCWLDGVTDTTTTVDPETIPELAGSWDRLDDGAKQYIRRTLDAARSLHENVNALAALAEQLQAQRHDAGVRLAQGA